jgi:hypothetical protein
MAVVLIANHNERGGRDLAQRGVGCRDERIQGMEKCLRVPGALGYPVRLKFHAVTAGEPVHGRVGHVSPYLTWSSQAR